LSVACEETKKEQGQGRKAQRFQANLLETGKGPVKKRPAGAPQSPGAAFVSPGSMLLAGSNRYSTVIHGG
jgi:hypothetical protein